MGSPRDPRFRVSKLGWVFPKGYATSPLASMVKLCGRAARRKNVILRSSFCNVAKKRTPLSSRLPHGKTAALKCDPHLPAALRTKVHNLYWAID
jgi:hypothetical protein